MSIVLRGSFNAVIFQPAWFAALNLIASKEAEAANVTVVSPNVTVFETAQFRIEVTRDRFAAGTLVPSSFEPLRDLVAGAFEILAHTPIRQMGVNYDVHCGMASEEARNELGFRLVPKKPWQDVLPRLEGMRRLEVQAGRPDDEEGIVVVIVQPSMDVKFGVYIQVNDHYELADDGPGSGCESAVRILRSAWDQSVRRSKEIVHNIFGGQ